MFIYTDIHNLQDVPRSVTLDRRTLKSGEPPLINVVLITNSLCDINRFKE